MKRLTKLFSTTMLLSFMCCLIVRANDDHGLANSITFKPTTIVPGSTAQLAIELENATAFTGFELDIMLPDGITAVSDSDGFCAVDATNRCDGHEITAKYQSSGAIKLLGFNTKNKNFIGNSGIICYLSIQAEQEIPLGIYFVLTINEVKFSEYANGEAVNHTLESATGTITVEAALDVDDNQLYAKDIAIDAGDDAVLNVYYNSTSDVYEYKTTIALPVGVTVKNVEFSPGVADVTNYTNDWSIDATSLTLHGEYGGGRRDVPAEGGNKMFATVYLNTSSLYTGVYDIILGDQLLSNDDDDYEPTSFVTKLIVEGDAPATINLTHGTTYTMNEAQEGVTVNYTRTFTHTYWQAMYVPFMMPYKEWSKYGQLAQLNGVSADGTALLWQVVDGDELMPNTPYIFKPANEGTVIFTAVGTSLSAAESVSVEQTADCATFILTGIYEEKTDMATSGAYGLSHGTFYRTDSDSKTLKPYQIYLTINGIQPAAVRSLIYDADGTTLIDEVCMDFTDDATYDLLGRKVNLPSRGIYIKNSKKFINK